MTKKTARKSTKKKLRLGRPLQGSKPKAVQGWRIDVDLAEYVRKAALSSGETITAIVERGVRREADRILGGRAKR